MKKLLLASVIAIAVSGPASVRAQSPKPHPSPTLGKQTTSAKAAPRPVLFRHPNAAQRRLAPTDLVAVTTPSGEKRYVRRKRAQATR
jgi:hypothetical protein